MGPLGLLTHFGPKCVNDSLFGTAFSSPASSLEGHVVRLADDVPEKQILQTCCKAQDGVRPSSNWRHSRGRPLASD